MPTSSESKHVAVFAFPFGSHPSPLLNLVLKLAHAAPHVTFSFISTAISNQTLFSKRHSIPVNLKQFTVSDGVPEGHVWGKHPFEKLNLFLQAGHENLQKGLDLAVQETHQRVTCIIADAFVTLSLIVAQNLNVPWIPVWLPLSFSLSAHFYTDLIRQKNANGEYERENRTLDFIPGYSQINIQIKDLPKTVLSCDEESLFSKTLGSMDRVLPQAKAVVINSYEELDPPPLVEDMKVKLQTMLYVGFLTLPLPPPPLPPASTDNTGCLTWLDKHSAKSVAYLSFGTEATPPSHELAAVAEALEESGVPFLWSLKDHLKGLLPKGFVERTSKSGKIVPWAPQSQVLAHDAIGVFVSHCGSNSMSESIANGVPMIFRPYFGDQAMGGRMVEDGWGMGVRMEGEVFTKNGLLKSLNLIFVQEEGKKIRENAQIVKKNVLDAAWPDGRAGQHLKTLGEIIS